MKIPPRSQAPARDGSFDEGFTQAAQASSGRGIALSSHDATAGAGVVALGADDSLSLHGNRPPVPVLEDTLPGWVVRAGSSDRKDLSLAEVRNMAASGAITARTMVKRPGGDWIHAGEFGPLRSALMAAAEAQRNGSTAARQRREVAAAQFAASPAMCAFLAWSGAIGGAVLASIGWWLGAVVAGRELAPLCVLGGLLGGFGASWLARTDGKAAGVPGAVAGILGPILGRVLVFQTMSSGILTLSGFDGRPSVGAFIGQGTTLGFFLSSVVSVLLGLVLGHLGAGRTR